ncbi:MAG: GGDEF domain-containing protein [Oscillospiraceae bacterium]|nr:GGDEF domain-containing protein [Oscillospiraceae bacterium]
MKSVAEKLALRLSSDPLRNLENAVKILSESAEADCFIAVHENDRFNVVASISEDETPRFMPIFAEALSESSVVLIDKELPEKLGAVACVPIIVENTQHIEEDGFVKRRSTTHKTVTGFVYFQRIRDKNMFVSEFLPTLKDSLNLLGNCLEFYRQFMLSNTDKLTGAYTRRYIDAVIQSCMELSKQGATKFSVIIADVDFFKQVNDQYGHLAGDDALHTIARVIQKSLSKQDTLGRYGGEEFVVVLDNMGAEEALKLADRLRKEVEGAKILGEKRELTISLGVSTYPDHADSIKNLLDRADKALYISKQTGRNKVTVWHDDYQNYAMNRQPKQEFFSGNNERDSMKMRSLYKIMDISKQNLGLQQKVDLIYNEIADISGATDLKYFVTGAGGAKALYQSGKSAIPHNKKIIQDVINTQESVSLIDWENNNIEATDGFWDWQSIVAVPSIKLGEVVGILYVSVSAKVKEFSPGERSYIQNAATIMSSIC